MNRFALLAATALAAAFPFAAFADAPAGSAEPAVVCHIKVTSDKVPDVSDVESWKKSFINDKMTNQEKAIAIWKSVLLFQIQDAPPAEYLQHEDLVYDPIKMFNVYGYGMCSPHSSHMEALARYIGFQARGWGICHHSVNEFFYDNAWHHFDSSLGMYYLKDDGTVAGVEDIIKSVTDWYAQHPEIKIDDKDRDKKLRAFEKTDNRQGWKLNGPKLVANSPCYDYRGWIPSGMVGWYAIMQAFDGTSGGQAPKAFHYEYLASMGYQVNTQLRPGETITRNWSNVGHHINQDHARAPGAIDGKNEFLVNTEKFLNKLDPEWPYLANGRIGNGSHEYHVPLAGGRFIASALQADNLAAKPNAGTSPLVSPQDPAKPAVFVLRMPSSYVYLGGTLSADTVISDGGQITVELSDNNSLDWKPVANYTAFGPQSTDLTKLIMRRYDYRLRFTLKGNAGLNGLDIKQEIQHSQRPLPALDKGENHLAFSAGAQESTITIEANNSLAHADKQVTFNDFHPVLDHLDPQNLAVQGTTGTLTVPVTVPGDMTRLRLNACYRTFGDKDKWDLEVSFNDGKTFKKIGEGPAQNGGCTTYVIDNDIPANTHSALVRYVGSRVGGNVLMSFRIDADYKTPAMGFRPVKVTYLWDEAGQPKSDVHIARTADEHYTITCAEKPTMKSIILELADQ